MNAMINLVLLAQGQTFWQWLLVQIEAGGAELMNVLKFVIGTTVGHLGFVVVAIVGLLIWRHSWNGAKSWTLAGPQFYVPLFWTCLLFLIGLGAFFLMLLIAPKLGNSALSVLKTESDDPNVFTTQGIVTSVPVATQAPALNQPELATPTFAPSSNLLPTGWYVATTTATVRSGPSTSYDKLADLPNDGTKIQIINVVSSDCAGSSICQRGQFASTANYPNGGWVHMSVMTSTTGP